MDFTKVSAPPIRVIRQPVPRPRPLPPNGSASASNGHSRSGHGHSQSTPNRSSSSVNGRASAGSSSTPRVLPKSSGSIGSSSSSTPLKRSLPSASSSSRSNGGASSSASKAKGRSVSGSGSGSINGTAGARKSGSASTASRSSTPQRKRIVEQRIQSESETSSDSSSTSASETSDGGSSRRKKARANGSSLKGSRDSRSTSAAVPPTQGGKVKKRVDPEAFKKGRDLWCLDSTDARPQDQEKWKGFVDSETAVRGDLPGWNGGKGSGIGASKYIAYFPQPGFEAPVTDTDPLPTVEVLYPAKGCTEKFVLLVPPGGAFEYNPVAELKSVLTAILDHYIPPSHRALFGTLSTSLDTEPERPKTATSAAPSPLPHTSSPLRPEKGDDAGRSSGGSMSGANNNVISHFPLSMPTPVHSAPSTPLPLASDPFSSIPPVSTSTPISANLTVAAAESTSPDAGISIGTALRRALAPNRRDGPGLVAAVKRYNAAMLQLQESGEIEEWLKEHQKEVGGKEWSALCERVNEMAYARVVGPYSKELEHHPKHPEEVAKVISGKEDSYGELRHNFMSSIISLTNLSPSSVFLDLGSGVGNCILQTALQAGCESYGVELLPVPSHCARLQLEEAKKRWAMWGIQGNGKVEVEEGDMRGNARVAGWLRRADVVLVNNEVFSPSLNDDLKNMFLDLKDGAKIVSLKPFVNEGFRMNESNCDAFDAICNVTKHNYYHSWVSWKGDMGEFYVQEMDRKPRLEFEKRLMRGGGRAARSAR